MPSYLQLAQEAVWGAQYTPPVLTAALIVPLRHFYSLGPASIGAAGDNNHLYGRHRSYNWDKQSAYCTNRSYGTTDGRDQGGAKDWYRACDVGITGQKLFDASRRMDAAVRGGRLPGVAEWFGTFDGVHVVGWFEGHASSSDSSHLSHLHVGVWNQYANDPATMKLLYATITGAGSAPPIQEDYFMHRVRSGAGDGSIYLVPGYAAPSGKLAALALDGPKNDAYASVPIIQLPNGVSVAASGYYDVDPQPWPVGGDAELSAEDLAAIEDAAERGAEAGAPTEAELVEAARQGSELASDS